MKKIILSLFVAVFAFSTNAQIKTPAPSPSQKIEQMVGLTDVTLEYSRPSMKGRKIFGGLQDYGKVWRTGANKNTTLTFSTRKSFRNSGHLSNIYSFFHLRQ